MKRLATFELMIMNKSYKDMQQYCPKCGRSSSLQPLLTLVFDCTHWLMLLTVTVSISALALKLTFSAIETSAFVLLALVALCVSINIKNYCANCEIEFASNSKIEK